MSKYKILNDQCSDLIDYKEIGETINDYEISDGCGAECYNECLGLYGDYCLRKLNEAGVIKEVIE